jgi:hypothetical protein
LAATAHWLVKYENKKDDWEEVIKRRKGPKTEDGRLERAFDFLKELHLPPATAM